MALKPKKSLLGELRKLFSNEKGPTTPAVPPKDQVNIPIHALCVRHYGVVQDRQLTFYSKTDKTFLVGDNHYHIPLCLQPPGSTELDPSIRRFTWTFKEELASESTPEATLESLRGAYSVFYKDPTKTSTASPKTLEHTEGDFWMLKQVQRDPRPGETIEWEDIPQDMLKNLADDWWSMSVQWTDLNATKVASMTGQPF